MRLVKQIRSGARGLGRAERQVREAVLGPLRTARLGWRRLSDPLKRPEAVAARWARKDGEAGGAAGEAALIEAIRPHFDAAFYATWYGITADPVRDYLREGWRAGRDPRPDFSGAEYLAEHPYLRSAGVNPFLHHVTALRARGVETLPRPDAKRAERLARRLVDGPLYLENNPDLRAAGVDPAAHYMNSGWREGRDPTPRFGTLYYCLTRGISYAERNPLVHYVQNGGEARPASEDEAVDFRIATIAPYFDAAYYRQGKDARPDEALLRAYAAGGWREMRSPHRAFDPAGFVQARAGSRVVRGDPFFRHVAETLLSGGTPFSDEGASFPAVDEDWYRATYADMRAGATRPYVHFSTTGWREGRDPGPRHSTLYTLLRVCGLHPARPPVEDLAWIGAIGHEPVEREAYLRLQAVLVAQHFDHDFYRRRYGVPAEVDAVLDYCDAGWRSGRDPRADFNGLAYLDAHGSVAETGIAPFVHHLAAAIMLGRDVSPGAFDPAYGDPRSEEEEALLDEALLVEPHFDTAFYVRRYPDVASARGGPLAHFVGHGQHEGRDPSKDFSIAFYEKTYGHMLAPGESPFLHYVRTGKAAGLMGSPEDLGPWPPMEAPEPREWDALPPRLPIAAAEAVVIVPVYKGRGETLRAIHACLCAPQRTPFTLLAINDRSPDPELTRELAELAGRGLFHLVENEQNLGFVRSVNRGLSLREGKAVVLLNSDAQVFGDWLDRLVAHAEARPRVGSVTPLSNNATICSYPKFNANNTMRLEIARAELDASVREINRGRAVEVPTGVGFCMYLTAEGLGAVGDLDEVAFGKGYGEENDWCMRARKRGFSNLLAEDVFVYHAGQISFGLDEGGEYDQGQSALLAKHPDYPGAVGEFVRADPGQRTRIRIDLYRLARHFRGRAALFVTHSWGGGIQRHTEDMIARLKGEGIAVVILSVDAERSLQINVVYRSHEYVYLPSLHSVFLPRDADEIAEFVRWLDPLLIHVHSLAGLRWSQVHTMMRLVSESGRPYAWTLHDFSPVCHRNHLVQPDGTYCGLAPVPVCRGCLRADPEGYEEPDPEERRAVFGRFLAGAARVFAPSTDTAARVRGVYPDLDVTVRPHFETDRRVRPSIPRRPEGRARRVAVLGAISTTKGGRLLQALAQDARDRGLPIRFSVIGFSDPQLVPALEAVGVFESGRYASDDEALDLVARDGSDIVLLPAIWPETYSYALTLALRSGLPVAAFDLGAQGARLAAYPNGHRLPYALLSDPAALNDRLMAVDISPRGRLSRAIEAAEYPALMRDYYGLDPAPAARPAEGPLHEDAA